MTHGKGSLRIRRVQPKLRMICGGDAAVNGRRARTSGAVQKAPASGKPDEQATMVSVFVELDEDADSEMREALGPRARRRGRLVTAEVAVEEVDRVAGLPGVSYVTAGETLNAPTPVAIPVQAVAPSPRLPLSPLAKGVGSNVLLGFIDVGGFDFSHPEFLDADGGSRFVRIWDQGADGEGPDGFAYGVEYDKTLLDRVLEFSRNAEQPVAATDILRQSGQVVGSHGTHVASIAGGKHGVCPGAKLAGVVIALTDEEEARERSFYDSTRLAHAVDYLLDLAREVGPDGTALPVVINISLGTNGHAHDGSSPISRWIDAALTVPGRCVCVAAGNAGQEAPQFPGDIGDFMGRIHTSGRIAASGLEADIDWQVVGNGDIDLSENELEIWYEPQDRFDVLVKPPGEEWIGPIRFGEIIKNRQLANGTYLSVISERYNPANGLHRISVFLSPNLDPELEHADLGVKAGTWTVRLRGREVRDGRFHAWIERDDPRPLGRLGAAALWRFPSYFALRSNVDQSSVNSLACGNRILSVANLDERAERINTSSSQGPTRDGRFKPEVAAPGTDIVAARGFSSAAEPWLALTGTSMASPYAAGVAALMLSVEPRLTASQIIGIMRSTAHPLPGADYRWQDDAGFGRIRPVSCIEEAETALAETDLDQGEAES